MSTGKPYTELMKEIDKAQLYTYSLNDENGDCIEELDDLTKAIKMATELATNNKQKYFITAIVVAVVPSDEIKVIK